jgi:hypothetical protein
MRIWIQQLKLMRIHADPDPKPCWEYLFRIFGIVSFQCTMPVLQTQ